MKQVIVVVGPLEPFNKLGDKLPAPPNFVFDKLAPGLCATNPGPYQRLSEMLDDGWTVSAMTGHPTMDALVVALAKQV